MTQRSPFRYFKTSPEMIRLAAMTYIRFPLSFRSVEALLHERGVDICHETERFDAELIARLLAFKPEAGAQPSRRKAEIS